ncbi:MAG TPA: alpha/beta hydrolase [Erysipelotrichaceae bacterium]|nr:alpha/beta hydrolase [Erysipelotrichaceae bacterium]
MIKDILYVSPFDHQRLKAYLYEVENAKALIVVFHGMAEHQKRYAHLALKLSQAGFNVLTIDHRGHGESLYDGTLKGYFADQDGWQKNLEDCHTIIKDHRKGLPLILFGHSMGSLFARLYLKAFASELTAVYLSGSPDYGFVTSIGLYFAKLLTLLFGKRHASPLFTKLTFSTYNKQIENPRTSMDWLSVNPDNVDAYIQDPLCGFDFTTQAFIDMLEGMADVYRGRDWNCNDPELPIRFESGAMDPCFEPGGLKRAVERLESIGYRNVTYRLIEGCRHEIYNEIKRDALIYELITWLDDCLSLNRR